MRSSGNARDKDEVRCILASLGGARARRLCHDIRRYRKRKVACLQFLQHEMIKRAVGLIFQERDTYHIFSRCPS